MALSVVHYWLRLLVLYHSPAVAQHLDRALPGWEKSLTAALSGAHSRTRTADTQTGTQDDASEAMSDGKSEGKGEGKGGDAWGVPLNWICGMFAGSLPAEHSSFILDWALISQQRYAGT